MLPLHHTEKVSIFLAGAMPPTEHQDEAGKRAAQRKGGLMANMLPLRQRFAKGIRQLAEVTADHLSRLLSSPSCLEYEARRYLVHLKYWALHPRPLMVYPKLHTTELEVSGSSAFVRTSL